MTQSFLILWSRWVVLLGTREFAPVWCFPECLCGVFHCSRARSTQAGFCCCWILTDLELGFVCWVLLLWTRCCISARPVCWLLHSQAVALYRWLRCRFSSRAVQHKLNSSVVGNPNPQEPEGSRAPEISMSGCCPSPLQNELGSIILPWWAAETPCTFPSLIFTAWQLWLLGRRAEAVPCAHTEKLRDINGWPLQVGEVKFLWGNSGITFQVRRRQSN